MKEMKLKLPKNKFLKFLIILIAVYLGVLLLIKIVNINSKSCSVDADCIYHQSSCFPSCGPKDVINTKYETTKNIELVTKCIPQLPAMIFMTNYAINCIEMYPTKPYCNKEKKCDSKIDCELLCEQNIIMRKIAITEDQINVLEECNCEII